MQTITKEAQLQKPKVAEENQAKLYWRLLSYLKPYWFRFSVGSLAALPAGGMDAAIAWLAGQGLQKMVVEGHRELIYWVPVAVLIVAALQGFFRFLEAFCIRYAGAAAIRDLRNEMFNHIEKQPLLFFQGQSSGLLIGRMINDVGAIENAIAHAFRDVVSRTVNLISLACVILYMSWKLAFIALAILSFIVLPVIIFGKRIRKSSRTGQEAIGDLVSVLSESIQGAKVIQSFNLEKFQVNRFVDTNQKFFSHTMKAVSAEALLSPILAMIGALGIAAVIWVAGYQVVHNQMTIGALTSFIIALLLLYSPIKTLGRVNGVIQPALSAASRVFEVLDTKSNLVDSENACELPAGPHTIELKHLQYHYPTSNELVLKDINLLVPPGRNIALVGLSGSGKSTLANLILRFFDTTSGDILIDGKSIKDYTIKSLRSQIAIVTQDNFLFNATIEENIRLGKLDATPAEIEAAAKAAFCHDFVTELPEGYKTTIGERGVRLSGGQQQRLSIARAFLKDAPILILDEATSALDNESEAMVQAALDKLMEGRTVIVIAHRLTTVRHADEIVVLENGAIVETGNHQVLESKNGHYTRLLNAQFQRHVT